MNGTLKSNTVPYNLPLNWGKIAGYAVGRWGIMKLTDRKINTAKAKDKPYKLFDGKGLYLLINPSGSKLWRFRYRFNKKEKLLSLGIYPDVSLKKARDRLAEAREILADGMDPSTHRKEQKQQKAALQANTFEAVAREWSTKKHQIEVSQEHARRTLIRLEQDIFHWLGSRPITEITPPELLEALRRVENRGAIETAHRIKQACGQVFQYAISSGLAERDITADLKGALTPYRSKHFSTVTDAKEIGPLLRAIDTYQGHFITHCALKLLPLVFVRPGMLRQAEWAGIDIDNALWTIKAKHIKMKREDKEQDMRKHYVPLSRQALEILKEIQPLTGNSQYVFHGVRSNRQPISENTMNQALNRLGYKNVIVPHGFRHMASTVLNENGFEPDWIEVQLCHVDKNTVRATYNHAKYLEDRKKMLQWWADYLDRLKHGAAIIPFKKAN